MALLGDSAKNVLRTTSILLALWLLSGTVGATELAAMGCKGAQKWVRVSPRLERARLLAARAYNYEGTDSQGEREKAVAESERRGVLRQLASDIGYSARTLVVDGAHVFSSPARMSTKNALVAGGVVVIGGVIYAYDEDIHAAFSRSRDDKLYKPIRKLGEAFERVGHMGVTNKFYFGGLALGYVTGYKPLLYISLDMLESHFIAGSLKNLANFAGRKRPFEDYGPYHWDYNNGTSFPSGHASNIMQVAAVVSRHVRFLPVQITAYTIAGAVCLERITSDAHWPSDVYFAAVYGWTVSQAVLDRNFSRRLKVVPTVGGGNGALGLALLYRF